MYLKGTPSNLDKAQKVLATFSTASGAKVNWHKSTAIWASKNARTWQWGTEVGLKWVPNGEGTKYLGVLVGFHLPPEANFDKLMVALKNKLIAWSHNLLSLAGRILVANQVLLASMWYITVCWNPNPRMTAQIKGVIRNFIWGGKDAPARAKVRWETLIQPAAQGGLGIIDPKAQSEAFLAKLMVKGLAPGGEPWKEIIQSKADQIKLLVHSMGPDTTNVNWIFSAPKLKRIPCSMWKSIVGTWMKVRPGLTKTPPTCTAEIFRQPIFGNPLILNLNGVPLGLSGLSEGNAFVCAGCTRIKDLWNRERQEWKSLAELGMSYHASNKKCKETFIASIPWPLSEGTSPLKNEDWISDPEPVAGPPLEWIYFVLKTTASHARVVEFRRMTPEGRIQASTNQTISINTGSYLPVRILSQESSRANLRIAKELKTPNKKTLISWIFEFGFIQDLPWDPGEWHWKPAQPLGDAPLFGYIAKRGYINAKSLTCPSHMITFIRGLNLKNTTINQAIARIWHNSRPRKVGTLIWLTLNQGLPVGSWLKLMDIHPNCKVCNLGAEETLQHCLLECPMAQKAWNAFKRIWSDWKSNRDLKITWPFALIGEAAVELDDDTPGLLAYNPGGYTYTRQPLDIFRSLILFHLWTERCRKHFDDQYSLKKVLLQALVATVEVGMATWKAIRSHRPARDLAI